MGLFDHTSIVINKAAEPLDITKLLSTDDVVRYTVPAGGPFVTGAPQSNTLVEGQDVLLAPLADITENTLTDPMTIADVLLFKEVSEDASAIKVKYYGATAAREEGAGEPNQGLTFVDLAVGFPAGTPGDAIIIRDSGITSNGAFGQDVVTGDILERQEAGITPPWRRIVQGIEDKADKLLPTLIPGGLNPRFLGGIQVAAIPTIPFAALTDGIAFSFADQTWVWHAGLGPTDVAGMTTLEPADKPNPGVDNGYWVRQSAPTNDVEAIRVTADIIYNTNDYTDQSATTLLIDGTGHSFRIGNNSHLTLLRAITADGTVTDTVQPELTAVQVIPLNADGIYDVWRTGDELTIQENQDIVRRSEVDVITSGLSDEITTRTADDVALNARVDAIPAPFSKDYNDLTNQPSIPQVSTDVDFTNDPTAVTDRATLKTALDSLNLGKWLPEVADIAARDALTGVVENDKVRVTDAGGGLWVNYQATQDNPAAGDWQIISEEGAQVPPLSEADAIAGTATTDSAISASTLSATIAARLYYDIRETYGLNQRVYDPASGNYYQSLQANNLNHPLNDAAWWEADLAATTDYIRNLGPVATLTDADLAAKFPVGDESRPLDIITVGDVAYQMKIGVSNPQVASSWEPVSIPGTLFLNEITVPIRSGGTNASSGVNIAFFDRNGDPYAPSNFVMNGTLTQYAGGTEVINFNDTPFGGNIGMGHNKTGAIRFSWVSEESLMNGLSRVNVAGYSGGAPNGLISGSFIGTSESFSHPPNANIAPPEEFTSQTQIAYDDNPDLTVNTGVGMTRQGLQSLFGGGSAKNVLEYPAGNFTALPINDSGAGDDGAWYKLPNVDALVMTLPNKAQMDTNNGVFRVSFYADWEALAEQPTKLVFQDDAAVAVNMYDGLPSSGSDIVHLVYNTALDQWELTGGGEIRQDLVIPEFADHTDVPANVRLYLLDGTGAGAVGLYRKEPITNSPNYVG